MTKVPKGVKINHHALYIKLMKRQVPYKLLVILENWLCGSYACVKWGNLWSNIFTMFKFGVRQGSVLSPDLFAIYNSTSMSLNVANFTGIRM